MAFLSFALCTMGSVAIYANIIEKSTLETESCVGQHEHDESVSMKVELLQTHMHKRRGNRASISAAEVLKPPSPSTPITMAAVEQKTETNGSKEAGPISFDSNGKVCLLCGKPLPERVDREYKEFRHDCGGMSSPTGPNASIFDVPAMQLTQLNDNTKAIERNGFCALNFAKSCVDAVANKDYLYWAKSLDLNSSVSRANAVWDGRYCKINGFLEAEFIALQHDFEKTQAKAQELCRTKYAKYDPEKLTFRHMVSAARYEDPLAPSLHEAELLAAWNCAMGDLGCDLALCAYSFCAKDGLSTGLYDECQGWDPIKGMPYKM